MESLNRDLVAIHMKWHMRLSPKKTKSMVVSRSRTHASDHGDLTLSSAELEKVKICVFLKVPMTKLSLQTRLREVVSKAAMRLGRAPGGNVIRLSTYAQELFQCVCFVQPGVCAPCECRLQSLI